MRQSTVFSCDGKEIIYYYPALFLDIELISIDHRVVTARTSSKAITPLGVPGVPSSLATGLQNLEEVSDIQILGWGEGLVDGNKMQPQAGWWFEPPEKYESQLGWLFQIYGKVKNVPDHQPDNKTKHV